MEQEKLTVRNVTFTKLNTKYILGFLNVDSILDANKILDNMNIRINHTERQFSISAFSSPDFCLPVGPIGYIQKYNKFADVYENWIPLCPDYAENGACCYVHTLD